MSANLRERAGLVGRRGFLFASLAALAAIIGGLCLSARETPAELQKPQETDRHVTTMVTSLLREEHLSKMPLGDEVSHRALDMFLKQLDPMKIYFQQSDVDEFMKSRDSIDDFVKRGDVSFSYLVFNRYLQRLTERVADVDELVDMKHDFTLDEEMVVEPDDLKYVANDAEAKERWRKRIKYELLFRKADGSDEEEAKTKIKRRYANLLKLREQTSGNELLEIYLTAITSSFDPHTTYMSPDTLDNFHINMRLNLEGIGAALSLDDGYTVVTKIIPGGAADKAGQLKPEDRIVSVGQDLDGEMVDVIDMKLSDVVKLIRGPADTIVRLGVQPADSTETKIYKITRARVELKDSEARGQIIEQPNGPDGKPVKFGVIDLPSFYMDMSGARRGTQNFKSTTRDVQRLLEDFKGKGVDCVLLDLRQNGGGSLTEAINLTGLFIDQGPVVQVKDADGRVQHYDDPDRGMVWSGPLVVLTSKFSASASEILAGAIQDYHRGIVVGDEATHGKGTVQSLLDLGQQLLRVPDPPNLGALKITMQQFYRPNGDSTQKRGVLADIPLPSLTSQMDVGEADLDFAIDFDQVQPAPFKKDKLVSRELVNELKNRSAARQKTSEDFAKLLKNITRYREQKDRKSVTLNEEKFLAERKEIDAEREEEKQFEEQFGSTERPVFDLESFYNKEVLAIAEDYLEVIKKQHLARLN
jgi:carboxyl-terminal processing protease